MHITGTLTNDTRVKYLENLGPSACVEIVIPRGSRVHKVDGRWVVTSTKLLIELTGNTHDPVYRYAWLPDDVEVEVVNG